MRRSDSVRDDMQVLTVHDLGAPGEHDLFMLARHTMHRVATLAESHPNAASAVVFQLLPTLAR